VIHDGPAWALWLEGTALAVAMRQWIWLYPIVEVIHIVGLVVLVGGAVMFDLRLLGASRHVRVVELAGHLLPSAWVGLGIVVPSGLLMFAAHAAEWATSPIFRVKMVLLAAAGLNVLLFHRGIYRTVGGWDRRRSVPFAARAAAMASLLFWLGAIAAGRMLAYV
jgi:hypothetical protein